MFTIRKSIQYLTIVNYSAQVLKTFSHSFSLKFLYCPFSYWPIILASSSVRVLLKYVFFTLRVFPEGRTAPVTGIGGSPSFCCKLSAITKKALRPIFILCKVQKMNEYRNQIIIFYSYSSITLKFWLCTCQHFLCISTTLTSLIWFTKNAHEINCEFLSALQAALSPLKTLFLSIFSSTLSLYLQDKTCAFDLEFSNTS